MTIEEEQTSRKIIIKLISENQLAEFDAFVSKLVNEAVAQKEAEQAKKALEKTKTERDSRPNSLQAPILTQVRKTTKKHLKTPSIIYGIK